MNFFEAIFKHDPNSTAIVCEEGDITYGQLCERTLSMARVLHSLDLEPGDRVALLLTDSPEFVDAFIAISSLGAIVVPINLALPLSDQRAIVHNSRARFVLLDRDRCRIFLTGAPENMHFPRVLLDVSPEVEIAGEGGAEFWITEMPKGATATVIETLWWLKQETAGNALPRFENISPDQPSFILYTSGSTGDPKGAVHQLSDMLYTNETYCREVLQLRPSDRLFSSSRLPFAYGLGNSFTFPLLNGVTSILCRQKPTAEVIARVFREHRPTIFFGVPVVYNLLLEHHRQQTLDCSGLRLCVSAGEALPAHLGEQWESTFGVKILDAIGSTEMLHMFMSNHEDDMKYGSSGKLLNGYEARLLDAEGREVDEGVEGNLWIKGESAAKGYWEKPTETARTFVDGWVRTGDLYRRDRDGYWFHMGRSDDCFKSSGQWVSPVEVESVLLRHANVARAAVVEDFDSDGLPCPCAFVVSEHVELDEGALEIELKKHMGSMLPRFKQPRRYVFVNELPYTATGKVQRFKLRNQLRERRG
ncbi:MAG: benzoate-CoA ligase family protein [Blastocatellia bacterium]|nr:MAG: benzoate-CoA ligase family protein [Blastocatellia bacterium]